MAKNGLLEQYLSLGLLEPHRIAFIVGIIEIAGAVLIAVRPLRPVIMFFFIWKIGTELFYPHWEIFEWVERGGSYGALLSLWFAYKPIEVSVEVDTHLATRTAHV